jgi:hypothetical protein
VLGSGKGPSSTLKLDHFEDSSGQSALIVEGSSIPLFLKFPSDKHKKGGDGLPPTSMGKCNGGPPMFCLLEIIPRVRFKVDNKPILNDIPNADGVATLEKNVAIPFILLTT